VSPPCEVLHRCDRRRRSLRGRRSEDVAQCDASAGNRLCEVELLAAIQTAAGRTGSRSGAGVRPAGGRHLGDVPAAQQLLYAGGHQNRPDRPLGCGGADRGGNGGAPSAAGDSGHHRPGRLHPAGAGGAAVADRHPGDAPHPFSSPVENGGSALRAALPGRGGARYLPGGCPQPGTGGDPLPLSRRAGGVSFAVPAAGTGILARPVTAVAGVL